MKRCVDDLAGNVSEWVEDYFAPYPGNPLTRYEELNKYRVSARGIVGLLPFHRQRLPSTVRTTSLTDDLLRLSLCQSGR